MYEFSLWIKKYRIISQNHFINFVIEFSLGQRLNTDLRTGNLIAVVIKDGFFKGYLHYKTIFYHKVALDM